MDIFTFYSEHIHLIYFLIKDLVWSIAMGVLPGTIVLEALYSTVPGTSSTR